MIRSLAFLALAASLGATSAIAAPASVQDAFGNTIVSTYPDGRVGKLWLHEGGTYTAQGRRGDPSSGSWKVSGKKLCLRQSRPLPMLFRYCTPIPPDGMDHAWAAKAATGEDIRVQVVRGASSPVALATHDASR